MRDHGEIGAGGKKRLEKIDAKENVGTRSGDTEGRGRRLWRMERVVVDRKKRKLGKITTRREKNMTECKRRGRRGDLAAARTLAQKKRKANRCRKRAALRRGKGGAASGRKKAQEMEAQARARRIMEEQRR